VIYVSILASCAPTTEQTKVFEKEQINRELEEELEASLNFLRRTTTSIAKPAP
jgi:hypothetical protein